VIAVSKLIQGITDVLQVLFLLAPLVGTIVMIANALKELHGVGLGPIIFWGSF